MCLGGLCCGGGWRDLAGSRSILLTLSVEIVCGQLALEFEELGLDHRGDGRRLTNEFGLDYTRCQIPLQNHTYEPIGARSGFFLRDVHYRMTTIPRRVHRRQKVSQLPAVKSGGPLR